MQQPCLIKKVSDGVWIGNSSCSDPVFYRVNDISAVIRLDKKIQPIDDVDYFDFVVPDNELMDMEFQKVSQKLDSICETIAELRANNRNILVQCGDGKNKSALVVGYYLTRRCGLPTDTAVAMLTTIYFTPEQVQEDVADKQRLQKVQCGEDVPPMTTDALARQEVRRGLRTLTNVSFQKIIRAKK
jgi:hypothetical protein